MKIAIVQDELVRKGGAEQVVLSFHKAFPEAPIYTLSYNPDKTYPEFKQCEIRTSWFGKLIKGDKNLKRFFFPFGVIAMKQLEVRGYDIILQSTTHCAKYIDADKNSIVITYCHTPFRLVWRPDSYEDVKTSGTLKRGLYNFVIGILKGIDKKSAERTDWFLTNAAEVVPRIVESYQPRKPVTIISPDVKVENFQVDPDSPKDYYLVVSRFEPYKKVDLVIEVFNSMPDKKLIIVGKGSMEQELRDMAGENISFMNGLEQDELAAMYTNCKALIFPQHEDYGITPLEANASGRPVIAYGKGGVLDTMIPYTNLTTGATAVFFEKQNAESLREAVLQFEKVEFDTNFIRSHAEKFDQRVFVAKLQKFVQDRFNKIPLEN